MAKIDNGPAPAAILESPETHSREEEALNKIKSMLDSLRDGQTPSSESWRVTIEILKIFAYTIKSRLNGMCLALQKSVLYEDYEDKESEDEEAKIKRMQNALKDALQCNPIVDQFITEFYNELDARYWQENPKKKVETDGKIT